MFHFKEIQDNSTPLDPTHSLIPRGESCLAGWHLPVASCQLPLGPRLTLKGLSGLSLMREFVACHFGQAWLEKAEDTVSRKLPNVASVARKANLSAALEVVICASNNALKMAQALLNHFNGQPSRRRTC